MSTPSADYRNHRSAWTLEELRFLERSYGRVPTRIIADVLGRSPVAIRLAAQHAGLTKLKMTPWTDAEKEVIRTQYGEGEGIARVCQLLPERNREAIFAMAIKMGVGSPRNWHEDEIALLRQHYPAQGVKVADLLPGRTEDAVKLKACSLKLRYHGGAENGARQQIWSRAEWQLLKRHQHRTLAELMKYFPTRTLSSVKKARERLRKAS